MKLFKMKSIWMSDRFKDILKEAKGNGKPIELTPHILPRGMTDEEISKEYDNEYLDLETALATIHVVIKKQKDGQEGLALVDGNWNILHVQLPSGVRADLYFLWFSDGREWRLGAYGLGYWYGGYCFLSRKPLSLSESDPLKLGDFNSLTARVEKLEDIFSKIKEIIN